MLPIKAMQGAKNPIYWPGAFLPPITKKTHTMVLQAYAAITARNNCITNP
jgi:hypothetical protein